MGFICRGVLFSLHEQRNHVKHGMEVEQDNLDGGLSVPQSLSFLHELFHKGGS